MVPSYTSTSYVLPFFDRLTEKFSPVNSKCTTTSHFWSLRFTSGHFWFTSGHFRFGEWGRMHVPGRDLISYTPAIIRPKKSYQSISFFSQKSPENPQKSWHVANLTHFDAHGGNDPRIEPKISKSWSLWVSIDSALKDESIGLPNDLLALFIPVENGSKSSIEEGFQTYHFFNQWLPVDVK